MIRKIIILCGNISFTYLSIIFFFRYEDDDRRFYWSGRHGPRETERESRQSVISRKLDSDRRVEDWNEETRHRRRRETRDRRCCPDWEQAEHGKHPAVVKII